MRERKERKSRGSLSVLDEFTSDTGVGEIVYAPKANPEVLEKIERATRLADIPLSSRPAEDKIETNADVSLLQPQTEGETTLKDKLSVRPQRLNKTPSKPLAIREQTVSNASPKPLDRREVGVSSALDKPLDRREVGVSSALDKNSLENLGVSSALDKPLDRREAGVRKIEISALDIGQLVGKEKFLLLIIYDECKKLGELETNFIGTDSLKSLLNLDSLGLRNLIFRVKEKGFFEVTSKQLGRVGLRKFKISRTIYQQILGSALDSREAGVSSALDKPLDKPLERAPYSSSNNLNINTNTIGAEILSIPENLRRFGISAVNLQNLIKSGKTTLEVAERSLAALSFDVEHGKSGNLANILFGVLGSGREYISQKYSESLQKELDQELSRIEHAEKTQKELSEKRLQMRFKEYLAENPRYLDAIRNQHGSFVQNDELLEKVAFEKFKEQGI